MTYAASLSDNFRRGALFVDKILKGANPDDLPGVKRRTFLCGMTFGLLAAPLAVDAQQAGKVRRVGYLSRSRPSAENAHLVNAFREALRGLGYTEGENLTIEWRWISGDVDRLPEVAAELVRLPVDVIVAQGTPETLAVK